MIILLFALKTAALVRGGKTQRHRDSKAGALAAHPVLCFCWVQSTVVLSLPSPRPSPAGRGRCAAARRVLEMGGNWSHAKNAEDAKKDGKGEGCVVGFRRRTYAGSLILFRLYPTCRFCHFERSEKSWGERAVSMAGEVLCWRCGNVFLSHAKNAEGAKVLLLGFAKDALPNLPILSFSSAVRNLEVSGR